MFNLYDDDYESVQSDEDGGLGADVTDALDQYQRQEAERLASIAQQAHVHLDSVASQTLPIANAIAAQRQASSSITDRIRQDREDFKRLRPHRSPEVSQRPVEPPSDPVSSSSAAAPTTIQIGGASSSASVAPSKVKRGRPQASDSEEIPKFKGKTNVKSMESRYSAPQLKQQLRQRGISVDVSMTNEDMIKELIKFDNAVHVSSSSSSSGSDTRGLSVKAKAERALKAKGIKGIK